MRTRHAAALAVALLFLALAAAHAQLGWSEFRSDEGRFSILFPGQPRESRNQYTRVFTVQREGSFLQVDYYDLPQDEVDRIGPEAELDSQRDAFLKGTQGQLVQERHQEACTDFSRGRGLEFTTGQGNYTIARMCLAGRRMYLLEAGYRGGPPASQNEAYDFLNSFRLLGLEPPPPGWQELRSQEGRFRVLFPGEPVVQQRDDPPTGLTFHQFVVSGGGRVLFVLYTDYPENEVALKGVEGMVNADRDNFVKGVQGHVTEERRIFCQEFPGRDLSITNEEGRSYFLRMCLAGPRMYMILIGYRAGTTASMDDVNRFRNSFLIAR